MVTVKETGKSVKKRYAQASAYARRAQRGEIEVLPLVIGGIAVVGGGYLLYKAYAKLTKEELTLQYDEFDEQPAQIVINAVNPARIIKGPARLDEIKGNLIIVGGEIANPTTTGNLVRFGKIPALGIMGYRVDVVLESGRTIWVIRGASLGDTVNAANALTEFYVREGKLPTESFTRASASRVSQAWNTPFTKEPNIWEAEGGWSEYVGEKTEKSKKLKDIDVF